ncbi:MAG: L-threonylcarbamoyladenylate synthase [Agromyces sp.]
MSSVFNTADASELLAGMRLARAAIARGELVVLPTDTVYGLAADAFQPRGVERLLNAKGRDRTSPPPVLIPNIATLDAVAEEVPTLVRALTEAFWPGGLTVILHARSSLTWDLGETRGTVAVRMPNHPIAIELLSETGPLAVSSANRSGEPAARTAAEAQAMLGESVAVYLESGESGANYEAVGERPGDLSSTIVDATALRTGGKLRIVRRGVLTLDALAEVVGRDQFEVDDR